MTDMIQNIDIEELINIYVIPWGLNLIFALGIFIVGRWISGAVVSLAKRLMIKGKVDTILADFVASILSAILLLVVIIASLNQLGVDTTSLVALMGAAGLAVGLSLQDSLKSFAAGVMLIVFRPFKAGDFVEAGGVSGVVEKINIFSSTMRTGDNKEIIVPNGKIYADIIINYSARDTRRIDMVFGIGYDDDIKKAKELIWEVLRADERILKDPEPIVAVGELADSSVNFNVRPWVKTADYWSVLFDLNENVKITFDNNGITIPYPQVDMHVQTVPVTVDDDKTQPAPKTSKSIAEEIITDEA